MLGVAHVAELAANGDVRGIMGVRVFRERVVPALHNQPGFIGYFILASRERGRCLAVTLWDTEEDARLAGARLEQQRRTGLDELWEPLPIPEFFDVVAGQQAPTPIDGEGLS
jgi:heme-degrading monooxygenase HmoA